jgi:sigma-B regulation protein RsbU (phosphoserine phosphatase)
MNSIKEKGMSVLIADDHPVSRRVLGSMLTKWGYEVHLADDGAEAYRMLQKEDAPPLVLLDWMMPEMDGIEVCEKLRQEPYPVPTYVILLTSKGGTENAVTGLGAGADDYLTKPFDPRELRARLQVGERVIELQRSLAERVKELEKALVHVKKLQGLLPICSYCKKIRNDQNDWEQIEHYVADHSEAEFSHGVCPSCCEKYMTPQLEKLEKGLSRK